MNLNDLRKSPLFQGLSDEELQQLMDMAEPVSLRAGEILIRQNDLGEAAYVVISSARKGRSMMAAPQKVA